MSRCASLLAVATCALLVSCGNRGVFGESGGRETRPVEVLFHINRPSGARFEVVALQSANADHRFEGRVFETPQLFVLENATQPVVGIFRNMDPTLPLTVEMAFGTDIANRQEIPPGACCTVGAGRDCTNATPVCDDVATPPARQEIRFEIFSVSGSQNIGFSATLGDQKDTNITACAVASDICRTPAIFFLEDAHDIVSGVFSKFADQDPSSGFQVDLYVNDSVADSGSSTQNVIVSRDL